VAAAAAVDCCCDTFVGVDGDVDRPTAVESSGKPAIRTGDTGTAAAAADGRAGTRLMPSCCLMSAKRPFSSEFSGMISCY
jgi:hypothetical protein